MPRARDPVLCPCNDCHPLGLLQQPDTAKRHMNLQKLARERQEAADAVLQESRPSNSAQSLDDDIVLDSDNADAFPPPHSLLLKALPLKHTIGLQSVAIHLTSPDANVVENAVWALGNVLGDCARLRDRVEGEGGVTALVKLVDRGEQSFEKAQRRAVWAIFSYLYPWSSRKLPITRINHVLPCLARYIQETPVNEANMESIEYAVKSLNRIRKHHLQRSDFIGTGVVPRLVKLLANSSSSIALQKHVLKCLGYLVGGTDDETDVAVDAGLLPGLLAPLETTNRDLCRLALRSTSNVAAGSHSQVYALLDSGLLKPVVRILMDDQESTICRREACWTISNLTKKISGDAKLAQAFIEGCCVEALSTALLL
ncbi:hypothetical protein M407DRAFT_24521 [Tulasnella calospora MUT 4182]|uniref:IBB domain-containing protein n=1 Tax=Tulasnella calospora MUT 4182 TaxID=1051891 RepID=A0A0C3Q8M3_9AGAM|nr:hypothetical protein M407DRAFT_24521 [Tulasnella calospora MUT 4182]